MTRALMLAVASVPLALLACGDDKPEGSPTPEVHVVEMDDATCYVYDSRHDGGAGISCIGGDDAAR